MLVELRLMIYEHLIEAGDLGILRISKLVNQEAFPLLSEVAILRVNEPCPTMLSRVTLALTGSVTLCGLFTLTPPDYIQHLDLRLNMVHSQGFFHKHEAHRIVWWRQNYTKVVQNRYQTPR